MQKVLTAAEMREVDRLTTKKYGIPSIILMENAAHAVARVITEKMGGSVKGKSILVLCGKGNNGGDGAALARILWTQGADVVAVLFGKRRQVRGDARKCFDILHRLSAHETIDEVEVFEKKIRVVRITERIDFREVYLARHWDYLSEEISSRLEVAVDALLGTGTTRTLDGDYLKAARFGMRRGRLLVSLDVPSGLSSDIGEPIGKCFKAHLTVTFTAPKIANVVLPASNFNGEIIVADIGSPQELIDAQPSKLGVAEKTDAAKWIEQTKFSADSYKNKRGHALLIVGSENYSGAAVLAGNSAMRSGVGLVTVVTPKSSKESVASRLLPEVMVRGVAETEKGAISKEAFEEIGDLLEKADSVAVGCGLSQDESTKEFVKKIVAYRRQPTVVDADALNLLSPFVEQMQKPAREQGRGQDVVSYALADARLSATDADDAPPLILTPHEGEFMRLLGTDDKDVIKDRVGAVREFSQTYNVILVLKGERVLIGEPDGKVVVNPTGNAGLGKAGNGDTLTGIIAGFAAQAVQMKIDMFETVVAAVYLAGLAGDIAEKKYGKRVMTASDVRECLAEAFEQVSGN